MPACPWIPADLFGSTPSLVDAVPVMTAVIAGCVKPVSIPITPAAIPPAVATPAPPPSLLPSLTMLRMITSIKPLVCITPMNIKIPVISAITGFNPPLTKDIKETTSLPPVMGKPATKVLMADPTMAVVYSGVLPLIINNSVKTITHCAATSIFAPFTMKFY